MKGGILLNRILLSVAAVGTVWLLMKKTNILEGPSTSKRIDAPSSSTADRLDNDTGNQNTVNG